MTTISRCIAPVKDAVSRRSALAGLATMSLLPALAPAHASTPLAAGHAVFNVDGRAMLIDTTALPALRCKMEECGNGRTIEAVYSDPEPGARYLFLHPLTGRIEAGPLVPNSTLSPMRANRFRLGYLGEPHGALQVTVLGKVVRDAE